MNLLNNLLKFMVVPLGVEPSYSVLQTDASTVVARAPFKV